MNSLPENNESQTSAPPARLNHGQAIHFVAAQELLKNAQLTPETVELLIFYAPQADTMDVNPISDRPGQGVVSASIVTGNKAFNGNWYVDNALNAKTGGAEGEKILERGVFALADAVRAYMIEGYKRTVGANLKRIILPRH